MKFFIVFDKSGDTIPFEVKYNHNLFEYFVTKADSELQNSFSIGRDFYKEINQKITHLHWAISKTNEVFYDLFESSFLEQTNLDNYLNQSYLNKLHSDWVFSHEHTLNIDSLRMSSNSTRACFGNALHEQYPDDIRLIKTAPLLEKIGYIYPYREINMGVHRLECSFDNIEFKANNKWEVFANPFLDEMITNNDVINFSFGYTYVGRQYYNKFKFFDTELSCPDNYNYENLEFSFQVNLSNPETIPFSKESLVWADRHNIKLVAEQIPIANIKDLENKLFDYRKILYKNSQEDNRAKIILN
jgi:hypothetical protein